MSDKSRYIVGIDLGTTNTCVYSCDTLSKKRDFSPFIIPQVSSRGMIKSSYNLASALYLIPRDELDVWQWKLPWDEKKRSFCIGAQACVLGEKQADRFVHSAKSWLCHDRVHRKDKILPIDADPRIEKISPLKVTFRIIEYIKEAWNAKHQSEDVLEDQEVVITMPASFDELARRLTIEAAKDAGLKNVSFLEEPQAAFYAYLSKHEKDWEKTFKAGDNVLVVDVGGGTTDFSLISVEEKNGGLCLERAAVGDHLLLGGDNLDLSLQILLERKLKQLHPNLQLDRSKKQQIKMEAQRAKEHLLSGNEIYSVLIEGAGSSLVGGSISIELTANEVIPFLLEGFFGTYSYEEALKLKKGSALQTSGLPYACEPSIVKQLAAFIKSNADLKKPNYILFNGGTMKPSVFQEAITKNINTWLNTTITTLKSQSLEQSVAKGACYYGCTRRGEGVSIKGGCPKAYYLLVKDSADKKEVLTLVPRGAESSFHYKVPESFHSKSNTPLKFSIYCSHIRKGDKEGDLLTTIDEEMAPLPPLYTILEMGKGGIKQEMKDLKVQLDVRLSEIGVVELNLEDENSNKSWKLDFQFEGKASQEKEGDISATYSLEDTNEAIKLIEETFNSRDKGALDPLMSSLERSIGLPKEKWPPSLIRTLWDAAFRLFERRKASPEYEKRWWQLMGFLLRPGVGHPLDEVRVKNLWKLLLEDFNRTLSKESALLRLISLRRVASGFSKGQQTHLAKVLIPEWTSKNLEKTLKELSKSRYLFSEKLRLFASLERLDPSHKIKVGHFLIDQIEKGDFQGETVWSLVRLGSRHLLHASLSDIVSVDVVLQWLEKLLKSSIRIADKEFIVKQLAAKTGESSIDISLEALENVLNCCVNDEERDRLKRCINNLDVRTNDEVEKLLGDQLPLGLTLLSC